MACIERPDFAAGQPGQPDFNFADPIPRFTVRDRAKDSAPRAGFNADVLVLEIHFPPRGIGIARAVSYILYPGHGSGFGARAFVVSSSSRRRRRRFTDATTTKTELPFLSRARKLRDKTRE